MHLLTTFLYQMENDVCPLAPYNFIISIFLSFEETSATTIVNSIFVLFSEPNSFLKTPQAVGMVRSFYANERRLPRTKRASRWASEAV